MKYKIISLILFILLFIFNSVSAIETTEINYWADNKTGVFIENRGQWAPEVHFLFKSQGYNAWITSDGIRFDFYSVTKEAKSFKKEVFNDYRGRNHFSIEGHVVDMKFVYSNDYTIYKAKKKKYSGNRKLKTYYNYLNSGIGGSISKVPVYNEVRIEDVYPGAGLRLYPENGFLRYDLILEPGADADAIEMLFEGQDYIDCNEKHLILGTILGEINIGRIFAFQEIADNKKQIGCKLIIRKENTVKFETGDYDRHRKLTIDPLVYSTFLNGSSLEEAFDIVVDKSGCAYVTGYSFSMDFPITPGAYKTWEESGDGFISKLNSEGDGLMFSTFLTAGFGMSIELDFDNNIYVGGYTGKNSLPTNHNSAQSTHAGDDYDGYIIAINPNGTELLFATYLGGSGNDFLREIRLDSNGDVYALIMTEGPGCFVNDDAFQKDYKGEKDSYLCKLDSELSEFQYATYIGGSEPDIPLDLSLDKKGCAYITGWTRSTDYPISSNAFQKTMPEEQSAFITKIKPDGSDIEYSTLLSGSYLSVGQSLIVDDDENAYTSGITYSLDFPVTPGALHFSRDNEEDCSLYITKLNSDGSDIIYSAQIGRAGEFITNDIEFDSQGNIYLSGWINWTFDFLTTPDAVQRKGNSATPGFLIKVDNNLSNLLYSTYISGSNEFNQSRGLDIDGNMNAYITGLTDSPDFPVTSNAYCNNYKGRGDSFVCKIDMTTSISDNTDSKYSISTFPNPFNELTTIEYTLDKPDHVKIEIFNSLGKRIFSLVNEYQIPGKYQKYFDAMNLPSGMYYYTISIDGHVDTGKMALVR